MKTTLFLLFAAIAFDTASASVVWNETMQGDLSNNNLAPTPITFAIDTNTISGTMGSDLPSVPPDRDIFTFTLAPQQALTSINVQVFTPTNQSFYAISPGNTINVTDPATHLSNTLVKSTGELLPQLVLGSYSGGTGLTAPIGAGTYTIWFQELSSVVTYDIAYTVSAVPEPASGVILCGALVALCARRQTRGVGI